MQFIKQLGKQLSFVVLIGSAMLSASSAKAQISVQVSTNTDVLFDSAQMLEAFAKTSNPNLTTVNLILLSDVYASTPTPASLSFSKLVATVFSTLGNAAAAVNGSSDIDGKTKIAVATSIAKAKTLIGDALATSNSTAQSDKNAIAVSLAIARTVIGDAISLLSQKNSVSVAAILRLLQKARYELGGGSSIRLPEDPAI